MKLLTMTPLWAGSLLIHQAMAADPGTYPPVVIPLGDHASMNWTDLQLSVSVGSDMMVGAWKDQRMQEQDALERLEPQIAGLAEQVCVTPDSRAGDLMKGSGDLASRLRKGVENWQIEEARYHSGGGVELDANLDIRVWLSPAIASLAVPRSVDLPTQGHTGLLVDARGLSFEPCLAPTILGADGGVIVRAQNLSVETAQLGTPVLYITDPADPRAFARAGEAPLFARAASARGGVLVLDPTTAQAIRGHTDVLAASGRIVIVVGP